MKKILEMVLMLVCVAFLFTACSTTMKKTVYDKDGKIISTDEFDSSNNFYGKSVNIKTNTYGVEAAAMSESSMTPAFKMGFVETSLHTVPMKKGQSYKVTSSTASIWNSNAMTKNTIIIGEAPGDGTLIVKNNDGEVSADIVTEKQADT